MTSTESQKREITRIQFRPDDRGGIWVATRPNGAERRYPDATKRQVVSSEASIARQRWLLEGVPAQLVIQEPEDSFPFERRTALEPEPCPA